MTTIIIHRFFFYVQIRNIFHKLIQFHLCKFYAKKKKKVLVVGVSMFDPTREHDTNPTRVFSG